MLMPDKCSGLTRREKTMAYKSPIEQIEGDHLGWQPDQFDDLGDGWYEYSHGPYAGQVKLYGTPSDYGINGGRASKLSMNYNGKPLLNYDRGWDTPSGKLELAPEHQEFYDNLLSFLDAYGLDL